MPYFIRFEWDSGLVNTLGPIANDNPSSVHELEDRRIKRNCDKLVKGINKSSSDVSCETIYIEA